MATLKRIDLKMNRRIFLATEWAIVYTPGVTINVSDEISDDDCEITRLEIDHGPFAKHQDMRICHFVSGRPRGKTYVEH